ncbi:GLPGLI family protein [Chryseobacterium scophthalmum]|uniref:GLPGLI family protein n=1 Tax=Chryseobacterium scophthalmum TaxID=59733 RepID=A0A1N6ECX4_9FLAO|nr:GLPGLI family protein [Chryseobacterium scophthalmum]SIN80878.1 GLPGLI family protein [Chryseobacterium scophthalmum]
MKNILLTTVLLAGFTGKAQTHRFIYDVEYKKDSTQNVTTKENYHLDIESKIIKYYPRDFFVGDSLVTRNLPITDGSKFNTSHIITHKSGTADYDYYDVLENVVLKLSSKNTQNWKLTNEKKKVKDLNMQKATTNWGGRNWTAWFTTDIPFQEGPYKFHGLPGLITELYDDKNNYKFELVKTQKIANPKGNMFIDYMLGNSIAVDETKYKDSKLKYYDSPVNYLRNATQQTRSNEEFFLNDGTKVGQNNSREVNERLKEKIRKYNNPIELDKAIKYSL